MKRQCWMSSQPKGFLSKRTKISLILENLFAHFAILLLVAWPFSTCILDSCFDPSAFSPPKPSLLPVVTAFSTFPRGERRFSIRNPNPISNSVLPAYKPVVVVGKIIIDEYGDPYPDSNDENCGQQEKESEPPAPPKSVTIGGGGPQAAFGAAAALAVWDTYYNDGEGNNATSNQPPPIIFVAPVGKDWTQSETMALGSSLGASTVVTVHNNTIEDFGSPRSNVPNAPLIQTHLVVKNTNGNDNQESKNGFFTPRIRLWHDQDQIVHWYALNDSFGPKGADGLWRNNPSAKDLISILERDIWNNSSKNNDSIVLHAIAETWTGAAGGKMDFLPLLRDEASSFRNHLAFVGIEPVASGTSVTQEDAQVAASVLEDSCAAIAKSASCDTVFWCPDRELDQAILTNGLYEKSANFNHDIVQLAAIRDGPRGSTTRITNSPFPKEELVPAATLNTKDGSPIDPTGAGNAYSGAMTALLGNEVPLSKAACIATGVGAVVCEHEGLPPQSDWQSTLERIACAARQVDSELS